MPRNVDNFVIVCMRLEKTIEDIDELDININELQLEINPEFAATFTEAINDLVQNLYNLVKNIDMPRNVDNFVIVCMRLEKTIEDIDELNININELQLEINPEFAATFTEAINDLVELSEATVDQPRYWEQLICSIAFGELMVIMVILHPMDRGRMNAYVLSPHN
ncbi:hypothetical protein FQA39_LY06489 [Lamprigera yunnana]|nr:hypothetical protein FQA39_LY06489 [Lamprigera yunnana]